MADDPKAREPAVADGRVLVLPVCIVFQVDGGKIRRLDEYLDRKTLES